MSMATAACATTQTSQYHRRKRRVHWDLRYRCYKAIQLGKSLQGDRCSETNNSSDPYL